MSVFEPGKLLPERRRSNSWVWSLCLVVAGGATVPMSAFMYSSRGQQLFREGQQKEFDAIRGQLSPQQYQEVLKNGERLRRTIWYEYGVRNIFVNLAFMALVSGLIWYVFEPFAPVRPAYVEVLAVVASSSVIFMIEAVYMSLLDAFVGGVALRGDLKTLLPLGLPAFIGLVNPFTLWWMCIAALGLAKLYSARAWMFLLPLAALYGIGLAVSSAGLGLGGGVPNFHRRG